MAYLSEAPKSTRAYTAYKRVSTGTLLEAQLWAARSADVTCQAPSGAHVQAEQLATQTPLPPIPLQIRNAPTTLMRKLGYGKEYAYNPAYAHPVHNVSDSVTNLPLMTPECLLSFLRMARAQADTAQEYLPPSLSSHSSHSPYPSEHILRTPDAEQAGKEWAEDKLARWEEEVNGREKWSGRSTGNGPPV